MVGVLASVCLSTAVQVYPLGIPGGFRQVSETEFYAAPQNSFYVAWSQDGYLKVVTSRQAADEYDEREFKSTPTVSVPLQQGNLPANWLMGEGLEVDDGWLQVFDNGEWGGALIWFSKDGSRYRILDETNGLLVGKLNGGIYAILYSPLVSGGDLYRVSKTNGEWAATVVHHLQKDPNDGVVDGNQIVFDTDADVRTLQPDGTEKTVYKFHGDNGGGTVTRLASGDIWISTLTGLIRLQHKGAGFEPCFYVPIAKA